MAGEKRARDEDAELMNELFKKQKKTKAELSMKERKNMSAKLIGQARQKFVARQVDVALKKLKNAIKLWPHSPDAYQLMGLIAEEKGDEETALELWLLQAHFDRKKISLWQDLYHLAKKLGRKKESIYCITQIQKLTEATVKKEGEKVSKTALKKQDDVRKHRLELLENIGEWELVENGYKKMLRENPFDVELVNNLARLYLKMVRPEMALSVAERFLARCTEDPANAPINDPNFLCSCNIAIELYLDKGTFTLAKQLVERIMNLQGADSVTDLHPDISIKYCIAEVFLAEEENALRLFNNIRRGPPEVDPNDFGDLFFDFSQALMRCGHAEAALRMLEELIQAGYKLPIVIFAIAKCNAQMAFDTIDPEMKQRRRQNAEKQFRAVLSLTPTHPETRSSLAGVILDLDGNINEALELLDYNSVPEWSPEDSLIIALNKVELLRRLGRGKEATRTVKAIVAAASRPPPEEDSSSGKRRAYKTRLQLLTKNTSQQVMRASTLVHNAQGQAGSAVHAVAQLPLTGEKAPVAAAAKSAIAQYGKSLDKPLRLNEAPRRATETITDQDELEVASFLRSSEILQKAYNLIANDDDSEAEDDLAAAVDLETPAQSALVNDLLDRHANEDSDSEMEYEEKEDVMKTDKRLTWTSETIRQVLLTGDLESNGLWTLLQSMIMEVTNDDDPSMTLARSMIPVLHGAMLNRYKLFSSEHVMLIRQFVVAISFALGDFKYAYSHVRKLASNRKYHTNHFWNVLNALLLFQGTRVDLRSLMDILRSHSELNDCHPLFMILGNCLAFRHGSTKLALGPFLQARKLKPDDPLASLMLSILYLRLVSPRGVANRHYTFLHGLGYLDQYKRLRMQENYSYISEVEYNLGRYYHGLALNHVAAHHYNNVLNMYDNSRVPSDKSVHKEAAYNLHLILKGSDNHRAAHQLLQKYIVVE